MYNWADYVDPENIEEFKTRYGIDDFTYDTFASNDELLTQAPGRRDRPVRRRGADRRVRPGDGRRATSSRSSTGRKIPNAEFINKQFKDFSVGARPNNYHLPKDWGTTGIAVRTKVVKEEVKTWKQFFEVAPKYSGRIVIVDSPGDVFVAPLKALGYSLNSTDPASSSRRASCSWAWPRTSSPSTPTRTTRSSRPRRPSSAWSGPAASPTCATRRRPATPSTIPEDGTLYWMDTWVIFKDPPHPEAAHAFLNFIHEPEIQAKETETNRYATPNDEAKKLVAAGDPRRPDGLRPGGRPRLGLLEGAQDVSTDPNRVDDLGRVQVEDRRLSR